MGKEIDDDRLTLTNRIVHAIIGVVGGFIIGLIASIFIATSSWIPILSGVSAGFILGFLLGEQIWEIIKAIADVIWWR